MGFFSDLKEDLSQAVNELKPAEDNAVAQEEDILEMKDEILEEDFDEADLSDMLDKLDSLDVSLEEPAEEEPSLGFTAFPASTIEQAVESVATPAAPPTPSFVSHTPSFVSAPATSAPMNNKVASDEVSVIMESMIINGNMETEGSLDVRGSIVGNVEALGKLNITGSIQGDSSAADIFAEGAKITGEVKSMGAIKIGQSTTIIGNVFATSAVVAGAVKGDIDVKGPVILDSTAIVLGNIKSKAVQINNGAVIEGLCSQCYAEVNPISFFEELKKMK